MATERRVWRNAASYVALLAGTFLIASIGAQFLGEVDNYAYDAMLRRYQPPPWTPRSAILAIDERALQSFEHGMQGVRVPLARSLRIVSASRPKCVAIDLTLADRMDPSTDADLADAMRHTPSLGLATDLTNYGWENPLPAFAAAATGLGEVHAAPDNSDGVTRAISLEKVFRPPPPAVPD